MEEENIIINDPVKTLTTTIIGKQLNIGESTVRKYFNELQKAGYEFKKETNGTRIYQEKDIKAISKLITIKNKTGVSLTMAANVVAKRKDTDDKPLTPEIFEAAKQGIEKRMLVEFQDELINEMSSLKEVIENKILEENKALKDEMNEMKIKMDLTNELLKQMVDKQNEVKKLEMESSEEKKGFLRRLFGS